MSTSCLMKDLFLMREKKIQIQISILITNNYKNYLKKFSTYKSHLSYAE